MATRTYRVATFAEDRGPNRKLRFSAYTLWYSPEWPGCIQYDIEAESGTAAKKIAIARRREHEAALVIGGNGESE